MIIRDDRIVAAGALLPLAETSIHTERFGTRHRAALGITEQTDAVVVVVSEENGQISLVERARIVRNLTEAGLARAIQGLLDPAGGRRGALGWRPPARPVGSGDGRRDCASSAVSSGGRRRREPQATIAQATAVPAATPLRRERLQPRPRHLRAPGRQPRHVGAASTRHRPRRPRRPTARPRRQPPPGRRREAGRRPATAEAAASTSGEADAVAPTAAQAPR